MTVGDEHFVYMKLLTAAVFSLTLDTDLLSTGKLIESNAKIYITVTRTQHTDRIVYYIFLKSNIQANQYNTKVLVH